MNTWKKWLGLAAAAAVLAGCGGNTAQDAGSTAENTAPAPKTLYVGTNAEFAPFEFVEAGGQLAGFDIELLNEMGKAGGFTVTFKNMPWDGLFPSLSTGDNQAVIAAVTMTDDRRQSMDFSDAYFTIRQVVLLPQGSVISSAEELKNMTRIGVATGHTGDLAAQKILGTDSPKIARFDSMPLVFKELENGGLDAAISDSAVVKNYVKNNGAQNFNIIEVADFAEEYYGIAVKKGDSATRKLLNDSLQKVRDNGQYESIYKRYFAE